MHLHGTERQLTCVLEGRCRHEINTIMYQPQVKQVSQYSQSLWQCLHVRKSIQVAQLAERRQCFLFHTIAHVMPPIIEDSTRSCIGDIISLMNADRESGESAMLARFIWVDEAGLSEDVVLHDA